MKKIIAILALTIVFTSCDDGDVTEENIDFTDAVTTKCDDLNIIYQLKNNSALLMELSSTNLSNAFQEKVETRNITIINPADQLIYRTFDGTVGADNICAVIRPSSPNVISEWKALDANLQVTTTAIREATNSTGQSKIIKYRHVMELNNIIWQKPDGSQIIETQRLFGTYSIDARTLTLGFDETSTLVKNTCNNNSVYVTIGSESMQLKLDAANFTMLFPATSLVGTKQLTLNETNQLKFTSFSSAVTAAYFCTSPIPSTPSPVETWISKAGTGFTTGYIEVKTETEGINFRYTVTAKNTTMIRGTNTLVLKNDQVLGTFLSTN